MRVLVIGAIGAVGKDLLQMFLSDESVERIDIFVRREVKIPSAKLAVHVVDFDHPETWADQLKGDVLFSCMGTTIKAAGTHQAQWKVFRCTYFPMQKMPIIDNQGLTRALVQM